MLGTGSYWVDQVGIELTVWNRLALNPVLWLQVPLTMPACQLQRAPGQSEETPVLSIDIPDFSITTFLKQLSVTLLYLLRLFLEHSFPKYNKELWKVHRKTQKSNVIKERGRAYITLYLNKLCFTQWTETFNDENYWSSIL